MAEDNLIAISALQHWAYCPRQCALIHLDQAFDENIHTLRGQATHKRVDQAGSSAPKGIRVERSLPLWNDEMGLIGKADTVEFSPTGQPYPVEYKQGSRHKVASIAACDELQLAAQAICLEGMTGHPVPEGALFYASSKRRRVVPIDGALRAQVASATAAVRQLLLREKLPPPLSGELAQQRCHGCSLKDRCQPGIDSSALHAMRDTLFDPDR